MTDASWSVTRAAWTAGRSGPRRARRPSRGARRRRRRRPTIHRRGSASTTTPSSTRAWAISMANCGVALGEVGEPVPLRVGQRAGEQAVEHLGDGLVGQRLEPDDDDVGASRRSGSNAAGTASPVRSHSTGSSPGGARQVADDLERAGVGVVDVVEDDEQRRVAGGGGDDARRARARSRGGRRHRRRAASRPAARRCRRPARRPARRSGPRAVATSPSGVSACDAGRRRQHPPARRRRARRPARSARRDDPAPASPTRIADDAVAGGGLGRQLRRRVELAVAADERRPQPAAPSCPLLGTSSPRSSRHGEGLGLALHLVEPGVLEAEPAAGAAGRSRPTRTSGRRRPGP